MNAYLIAITAFSFGFIAAVFCNSRNKECDRKSKQEMVYRNAQYKIEPNSAYIPIKHTCSACLCDFWSSKDWRGEECSECSKVAHI